MDLCDDSCMSNQPLVQPDKWPFLLLSDNHIFLAEAHSRVKQVRFEIHKLIATELYFYAFCRSVSFVLLHMTAFSEDHLGKERE